MSTEHATRTSQPIAAETIAATHLGRFSMLGKAGEGAMGVVYAAYDPDLDRRVALKIVRRRLSQGQTHERARREALALARVSHPNVVPVYEVGEAGGRLFIAMEYVDGPSLGDWMTTDTHPRRAVLDMFTRIGRGLAAAHAEGLVHRDFKPDNVLVGRDGRPRVIDFGLAKADSVLDRPPRPATPMTTDELERLSLNLTRAGQRQGTLAYMAPEVMDGGAHSTASDQFSFCVALFEALFKTAPFTRESVPMLRLAIERGEIAAVDTTTLAEGYLAVVQRGLSADPAERWPSMKALLDALEAIDPPRSDSEPGMRLRLVLALLVLGVAVGFLGWLVVVGPPATPWPLFWLGIAITIPSLGMAAVLRVRFWEAEYNRRVVRQQLAVAVVRNTSLFMSAWFGLTTAQTFVVDASVLLGLFIMSGLYMQFRIAGGLGCMFALLGAMLVWPAQVPILSTLIAIVLLVSYGHAEAQERRIRAQAG